MYVCRRRMVRPTSPCLSTDNRASIAGRLTRPASQAGRREPHAAARRCKPNGAHKPRFPTPPFLPPAGPAHLERPLEVVKEHPVVGVAVQLLAHVLGKVVAQLGQLDELLRRQRAGGSLQVPLGGAALQTGGQGPKEEARPGEKRSFGTKLLCYATIISPGAMHVDSPAAGASPRGRGRRARSMRSGGVCAVVVAHGKQ